MIRARRQLSKCYDPTIFQPHHLIPVRGDLSLVYTTASLQPKSSWIDDSFHFVGPSINPATRASSDFPFDWLTGAPLVYLSLGTIHHSDTSFFRMACEALADFDGQVVMSIGGLARVEDFAPVPPNILLRNTVPQLEILQRAAVFITHGGMNSIHESLYFGVPMIVVPHQMEQLFNARIVVQQGAGLLVGGPFAPPVSKLELRAALTRIQDGDHFAARAESLGQDLRAASGYVGAADVILASLA
jgi:MGT family glycosyltransferase